MKKLMVLTAVLGLLSTGLYAKDGTKSTQTKKSYKKSKRARLLAKKRRQMRSKRKLAAQTNSIDYSPYIHKGFKVSVAQSNKAFHFTAESKDDDLGTRYYSETESGDTLGLSLGYQRIKGHGWGFSVLLSGFNSVLDNDVEIRETILEGNATYGITEKLYTYFGGSLSKMTSNSPSANDVLDEYGVGIGTQVALGYQFVKNFGAEVKYALTTRSYEDDDLEASITTSALQLGINGTF